MPLPSAHVVDEGQHTSRCGREWTSALDLTTPLGTVQNGYLIDKFQVTVHAATHAGTPSGFRYGRIVWAM